MWNYLRWHSTNRDPRPEHIYHTEVEVTVSKSPYAETIADMDVQAFDFSAGNYRLEALVAFSLFGTFLILAIFICVCSGDYCKFKLTEEQEQKFTELQS